MAIRTITDLPFFELSSDDDYTRMEKSVLEFSILSGDLDSNRYTSKAVKCKDLIECVKKHVSVDMKFDDDTLFNGGISVKDHIKLSGNVEINDKIANYGQYKLDTRFGNAKLTTTGDIELNSNTKITQKCGNGSITIKSQSGNGLIEINGYAKVTKCNEDDDNSVVNIGYLKKAIAPSEEEGTATLTEAIMNAIYPIGSIYISVNKNLPESLTSKMEWKRISQGRCLWGYDEGNNNVSSNVDSGLPNITGTIYGHAQVKSDMHTSGAFSCNGSNYRGTMGSDNNNVEITFDASNSNSIYGKSNIVQPPAFVVSMWQRTR